jgi:signal transduction histidine kinase
MDQDLLSRTLLRFVLEEGGARRVALALAQGEALELAADARAEGAPAPAGDTRVPWSLLAYVQRTGEPVLLDASLAAGRFAGDPYFADARPCSALCLPVRVRGEAIALLYLENDLVPGAFTPERLAALELLAAQAAISLENARLLDRERARRLEAEAAERRQLLLGAVTALMSQALDGGDLSAVLTRLCAGSFIDWAVLDLAEHGVMIPRAAAHRDPTKEPLLRELTEHYPPRPGATTLGWEVPPAGEVAELPVLGEDQIRARCVDERHTELLRLLGTKSAIIVPLYVRDAAIGALALAATAPPSRFTRADLALAVELGRRMTLAIDNARLLAETRRALHQREEFLRIASHELRTPLASLRLSAQALLRAAERKRAVPPEIVDQSLRRMLGNTIRLEQLTSELLDVTRIEQGRLVLNLADVALDAIARQSVEQLEPDLLAAGTPVSIECAAPIYGRWDPSRLDQVVTNLVVNASKFGAGKPIEIRIERDGDSARLAVIDRGIGIDPARRPYVFDRFERAVSSSSYGGLGLGLYIARSIIVAHGGTIGVESEVGAGSKFTVTLPCMPPLRDGSPI